MRACCAWSDHCIHVVLGVITVCMCMNVHGHHDFQDAHYFVCA